MAMLQCEVCGGKLKGKPGGIYECEFCGVEYDTAWAKAKIQEIKGTVQVEGTVEVTGTVKLDGTVRVEGGVTAESLLKRTKLALEDSAWQKACEYCDKVLDIDPENAMAYVCRLMAELKIRTTEDLKGQDRSFEKNKNYLKAIRFGDDKLNAELQSYVSVIKRREEEARIAEAKWQEEERIAKEKRQQETDVAQANAERIRKQKETELASVRSRFRRTAGLISAYGSNTYGVKPDGTVLAIGFNQNKECDLAAWNNLIGVCGCNGGSIGLFTDGIVRYRGAGFSDCKSVRNWSDVVEVSAGNFHAIGLRSNGTVVATDSKNLYGNLIDCCQVSDWRNIDSIAAGSDTSLGLRRNGTVVVSGGKQYDNVKSWKNIVSIAAGYTNAVGLKADGSVLAAGANDYGQCDVSSWTDIVAVAVGNEHTVGLKADGTVVAIGRNNKGQCNVTNWNNIVSVAAGAYYTVGLKDDGTVVAVGANDYGQCNVAGWKLFDNFDELNVKRSSMVQWRQSGLCQHCGGELKGVFSKKCVACGKPKDY